MKRASELRHLLKTNDTLGTSKLLKSWVKQGFLVVTNPDAGRNIRRYTLPHYGVDDDLFSIPDRKELGQNT